jgi:hypothetical protein
MLLGEWSVQRLHSLLRLVLHDRNSLHLVVQRRLVERTVQCPARLHVVWDRVLHQRELRCFLRSGLAVGVQRCEHMLVVWNRVLRHQRLVPCVVLRRQFDAVPSCQHFVHLVQRTRLLQKGQRPRLLRDLCGRHVVAHDVQRSSSMCVVQQHPVLPHYRVAAVLRDVPGGFSDAGSVRHCAAVQLVCGGWEHRVLPRSCVGPGVLPDVPQHVRCVACVQREPELQLVPRHPELHPARVDVLPDMLRGVGRAAELQREPDLQLVPRHPELHPARVDVLPDMLRGVGGAAELQR